MKKSDKSYLLGLIFTDVFCLAYGATFWFQINLPKYYPLEHTWKILNQQGVPSMGWYGKLLFAFLISTTGAGLSMLVFKYIHPEVRIRHGLLKASGIVSIMVIVGVMVWILNYEYLKWNVF
ncbi:MAG: hypothetical protein H8E14_12485 [Candidatus Marinimicrobia bacterium]|nr:hypothetical protein [Candidatus Neomarinimicrobiota bacterium]